MRGRAFSRLGLFVLISTIWGLVWIPAKVGATALPPLLFAATRGIVAGLLLLALHATRGGALWVARDHVARLVLVCALAFAMLHGPLFWGISRVESGLAAVVHFSLVPIFLLTLGVAFGEEHLSRSKVVSTALGVAGLYVLYSVDVGRDSESPAAGVVAIVAATACYALGVVLGRELLRHYPATQVAGWTQVGGASMLLVVSSLTEPGGFAALVGLMEPAVLASWAFLVVFGSVIAFTSFLRLTHEWSPSRAGYFAFISPAIAVVAGVLALGEAISPRELVGMTLMIGATALALLAPRSE
jgi:drug/metabolite transporter (DMT)-like permease